MLLDTLTPSSDRKVTNKVTKSANVAIRNTFGLPAGNNYACPGATPFCGNICYAGRLETQYTNVAKLLTQNFSNILYADYLGGINAMVDQLDHMVIAFVKESRRKNAPLAFRIHWDGDFFNANYARAWAIVCRAHKDVQFWVYTRSFFALPIIKGIPNLGVYISADPNNISVANKLSKLYNLPIAYVGDTFADAAGAIDGAIEKTYKCPENRGTIPLIDKKGSACMRCGVCVKPRGNVVFSVTKK